MPNLPPRDVPSHSHLATKGNHAMKLLCSFTLALLLIALGCATQVPETLIVEPSTTQQVRISFSPEQRETLDLPDLAESVAIKLDQDSVLKAIDDAGVEYALDDADLRQIVEEDMRCSPELRESFERSGLLALLEQPHAPSSDKNNALQCPIQAAPTDEQSDALPAEIRAGLQGIPPDRRETIHLTPEQIEKLNLPFEVAGMSVTFDKDQTAGVLNANAPDALMKLLFPDELLEQMKKRMQQGFGGCAVKSVDTDKDARRMPDVRELLKRLPRRSDDPKPSSDR